MNAQHRPEAKVLTFDSCAMEDVMAAMDASHSDEIIGCSPSLPPAGCVELTPLDVYCASFGLVRWAFVFPAHLDAPIVKAALSHVLRLYPLLAGRVVRLHGGDGGSGQPQCIGVSYDLSAHGLQFVQATCPLTAADIVLPCAASCNNSNSAAAGKQPSHFSGTDQHSASSPQGRLTMHAATDMAVINEHMATDNVDHMIDGPQLPLARAVMCHLAPSSSSRSSGCSHRQGGTLLCVASHHMLMDGRSLRMLLQDWAAVCRALLHGGCAHISAPPTFGRQGWDGLVAAARCAVGVGGEEGDGAQPCHWCCDLGPPPAPVTAAAAPSVSETVAAMLAPRSPTPCSYPLAPYTVVHFSKQHIAALKHQAVEEQLHGAGADGMSSSSSGGMHHSTDSSAPTTQHSAHYTASHKQTPDTAAAAAVTEKSSKAPGWVSSNDVVCAALWHGVAQLSSHTPGKDICFMRVFEFRPRLHLLGNVSLGKRACGNWYLFLPTTSSYGSTVSQLAWALRSDLQSQTTHYIQSAVTYLDWAEWQGLSTRVGLLKTSMPATHDAALSSTAWDASPQQLDFGWGPPVWFQPVRRGSIQNMTVVIPDMCGDGVWVWVTLTDGDYAELKAAGGFPAGGLCG